MKVSLFALAVPLLLSIGCRAQEEVRPPAEWPAGLGYTQYVRDAEEADRDPGLGELVLIFERPDRVILDSPGIGAVGSRKRLDVDPREAIDVLARITALEPEMVSMARQTDRLPPVGARVSDGSGIIFLPGLDGRGGPYWIPPDVHAKIRELLRPWDERFRAMEWEPPPVTFPPPADE